MAWANASNFIPISLPRPLAWDLWNVVSCTRSDTDPGTCVYRGTCDQSVYARTIINFNTGMVLCSRLVRWAPLDCCFLLYDSQWSCTFFHACNLNQGTRTGNVGKVLTKQEWRKWATPRNGISSSMRSSCIQWRYYSSNNGSMPLKLHLFVL